MCVRASYMKMTRGTNLMQQFIYYYITLHVSGIYVPIFRNIGCVRCMLLHMVFSSVKENCALVDGFVLCCSLWCVIVG
jgi:hypothetical protein